MKTIMEIESYKMGNNTLIINKEPIITKKNFYIVITDSSRATEFDSFSHLIFFTIFVEDRMRLGIAQLDKRGFCWSRLSTFTIFVSMIRKF